MGSSFSFKTFATANALLRCSSVAELDCPNVKGRTMYPNHWPGVPRRPGLDQSRSVHNSLDRHVAFNEDQNTLSEYNAPIRVLDRSPC